MKNHRVVKLFFFLTAPVALIVTFWSASSYQFVLPVVIWMLLYLLFVYRNTQPVVIMLIYVFIYCCYLIPYYQRDLQLSQYSLYQDVSNYNMVLLQFYFFFLGMVVSADPRINSERSQVIGDIEIKLPRLLTGVMIVFELILIWLLFKQGQNIFYSPSRYEAYRSNLEVVNSLPLFALVPVIFISVSIRKKRARFFVTTLLIGLLSLFAVTRGLRMVLVPYLYLYFVLFFDARFRTRTIIAFTFVGAFLILALNLFKGGAEMTPLNLFGEVAGNILISHHADMLYTCAGVFGLLKEGMISFGDRIGLLMGFIDEMVVPPQFLPDKVKYPQILVSLLPNGGGGFFLSAIHLMFGGYLGILVFGSFLGMFLNYTYDRHQQLLSMVWLVVFCFSPRWMSYDFHTILRLPIFTVLFYFLLVMCKWCIYRLGSIRTGVFNNEGGH